MHGSHTHTHSGAREGAISTEAGFLTEGRGAAGEQLTLRAAAQTPGSFPSFRPPPHFHPGPRCLPSTCPPLSLCFQATVLLLVLPAHRAPLLESCPADVPESISPPPRKPCFCAPIYQAPHLAPRDGHPPPTPGHSSFWNQLGWSVLSAS